MRKEKIRYYQTLQDDFWDDGAPHPLPPGYRWIRSDFPSRILSALIYLLALVFSFFYCRLFLGMKIVGAEVLRRQKGGFFLYGNHTQPVGDVFMPAFACLPKRIYTIVSSANLDLPFIGKILPYLGALPLPDTLQGMKTFKKALEQRIEEGHPVVIYPEAHVWEYYTGIRPFCKSSFKYPAAMDVPCYCMTTTYQKRRFRKRPSITIYIDGPFTAPQGSTRQKAEGLCRAVSACMKERSGMSDCKYILYRPK